MRPIQQQHAAWNGTFYFVSESHALAPSQPIHSSLPLLISRSSPRATMGWLQLDRFRQPDAARLGGKADEVAAAPTSCHVERAYPFAPKDAKDEDLCFISPDVIQSKSVPGRIAAPGVPPPPEAWIVVDNIVYDCSEFIHEHPGGLQVILSFIGEDCSWQFWRFHSKDVVQTYGAPLRIGRTEGVKNRFPEQPRYVGLGQTGSRGSDG